MGCAAAATRANRSSAFGDTFSAIISTISAPSYTRETKPCRGPGPTPELKIHKPRRTCLCEGVAWYLLLPTLDHGCSMRTRLAAHNEWDESAKAKQFPPQCHSYRGVEQHVGPTAIYLKSEVQSVVGVFKMALGWIWVSGRGGDVTPAALPLASEVAAHSRLGSQRPCASPKRTMRSVVASTRRAPTENSEPRQSSQ